MDTECPWENIPWTNRIHDVRVENLLTSLGIKTLGEIAEKPDRFWMSIRGLGKKSARIIKSAISDRPRGPQPEYHLEKESIPWENLIQDVRTVRRLKKTQCKTIGDLARIPDKELLAIPGLGKRCLKIIRDAQQTSVGGFPPQEETQLELLPPLDPDIFFKLPAAEAWKLCQETASVPKDCMEALLSTETQKTTGNQCGVTKERIRQRIAKAIKHLTKNSETYTALDRWFKQTESDLVLKLKTQRRGEVANHQPRRGVFSKEEEGLLRIFAPNRSNWVAKHNLCSEKWCPLPTEEETSILREALSGRVVTTPADLSDETGIPEEIIQGSPFYRHGYVSTEKLTRIDTNILKITEPWRRRILVPRKEIAEAYPDLHPHDLDDLLHRNPFVWNAGPFVILLPRNNLHPPSEELNLTGGNTNRSKSQMAIKALAKKKFWRTKEALAAVKAACGIGATYWVSHLHEVRKPAPGILSVIDLSGKDMEELHQSMMNTKDLKHYLLAKESGSKLANFEAWTPKLEWAWARWLNHQTNPTLQDLEIRLSRVAKPELWPADYAEKSYWKKQYRFLAEQTTRQITKKKGFKWQTQEYASAGALALATGGVSVFDFGLLKGRVPSSNTDELDNLVSDEWLEPGKGVEWRSLNPKRTTKESIMNMLQLYSDERRITHKPTKRK